MPRLLLLFLVTVIVSTSWTHRLSAAPGAEPVLIRGHLAHPTRILARRAAPTSDGAHTAALAASGMTVVRTSSLVPGLVVLDLDRPLVVQAASASTATASAAAQPLPADEALLARIEALRASGLYAYVEPDYLVFEEAVPSDTAFTDGTLWGLRNTGQSGGVIGCDIGAEAAWDVTTGSTGVVVAVIDSGARLTHLDLASQLWRNPGEIAGNGRDDDGNGYIDDVHGINAITGSGDPSDDSGHGTHVAGTIGAAANNGQPMVGVAWRVRLMICKFLPATGEGLTSDAVESVSYATAHGAKILNCSWGGLTRSRALEDALAAARAAGVLVVASAGNDSTDNDRIPHYPSGYDLDNIISVAAFDRRGHLASFSNYGAHSVDLAAPGESIYSTLNTSDVAYGMKSGTSMAAPHVSGVAALVLAARPGTSVTELRDRLLRTVVPADPLTAYVATGGRVHAHRALTMVPDGRLEISISPRSGAVVTAGRDLVATVRVTDLVGVSGATVAAVLSTGGSVTFRDDGVAPDAAAGDANYTATIAVPRGVSQMSLDVTASAPRKTTATERFSYVVEAPPANDMFADRTLISGTSAIFNQTNRGASRETAEPAHAGKPGGASVWWTWTASAQGTVTIDTEGSDFDTVLAVYTGSAVGALTEVASNDDIDGPNQPSRVSFPVVAGTTYQIAVDGFDGGTGSVTLRLSAALVPVNDRFSAALPLTGASVTAPGTTILATLEPGEPLHGVPGLHEGTGSVWWAWTAPADGAARVSAGIGHVVEVYAGGTLETLVRAPGRRDDFNGFYNQAATFGAHVGETYWICVSRIGNSTGADFTLTVAWSVSPANDHLAGAFVLAGDAVSAAGQTTGATREIGEMPLPGFAFGSTLWWRWTPTSSGTARLLTTGSDANAAVAVFSGTSMADLSLLVEGYEDYYLPDSGKAEWHVTAGATYFIALDSMNPPGAVRFSIEVVPTPVNDDFARRIVLDGRSVSGSGRNLGATREPGEPVHWSGPPRDSRRPTNATLWWAWTAPADGTAIVAGIHVVGVYTGAALDALVPVPNAHAIELGTQRVIFHARAGVQYQIARDSRSDEYDDLAFTVDLHEAPTNDMFASSFAIGGTLATLAGDTSYATREADEARPYYNAPQHAGTLWWTWLAPISGSVTITATTTQTVAVLTGNPLGTHQVVVEGKTLASGGDDYRFAATAGQAYHIAVMPYDWAGGPVSLALECVTPPANDMFAGRIALSGSVASAVGTTQGATREQGEPYSGRGRSVWWTWTAPGDGVAEVSTAGSVCDTWLAVATGDAVNRLTTAGSHGDVSDSDRSSRVRFAARRGQVYHIIVDVERGSPGEVAVRVELGALPSNDRFAARETLEGATLRILGSNLGATAEPGEPAVSPSPYVVPRCSLWWSWTAPSAGTLMLGLSGSAHSVAVFSGTSFATMVRLPDVENDERTAHVHVEAGQTYQISVDSFGGTGSDFVLDLGMVDAPVNDMFAARAALTLNGASVSVTGSTVYSTAEIGESAVIGRSETCGSVWWTWTAPRSGNVALWTTVISGMADIQVFTGSSLAALVRVASGDHRFGGASVAFRVEAGTTYVIAVTSHSSIAGRFSLSLELADLIPNDTFAGRATLTGPSGLVIGSSLGATLEPDERRVIGSDAAASMWWSWTAPLTGTASFDLPGASWVARVRAFTGTTLGTLVPVPHAPERTSIGTRFHCEAGVTYVIALFHEWSSSVGGPFMLEHRAEPGPDNDMFAGARELAGSRVAVAGSTRLGTPEPGEAYDSYNDQNSSLWWTWRAPASGILVVGVTTGGQEANLVLGTGDSIRAFEAQRRSLGKPGLVPLQVRLPVSAGVTYRIGLSGTDGPIDAYTLDLVLEPAPANDSFAARSVLSGADAAGAASNRAATNEPGETAILNNPDATVWWTWTAPTSGRAVVSTDGSSIHTTIVVCTGESLGALTPVVAATSNSAYGLTNNVAFDAVAGTAYQIVVDSVYGGVGDLIVRVFLVDPPANDLFQDRRALSGESDATSGNNLGATLQAGEPSFGTWGARGTLWWAWTAPRSGRARFSTEGSAIDTVLGVFRGGTLGTLAYYKTDFGSVLFPDHPRALCDVDVVAGETYPIAVSGANGAMGAIELTVAMYEQPVAEIVLDGTSRVPGSRSELTARVAGLGPYRYQWYRNEVPIDGATGPTLSIESLQQFHAGAYRLSVTSPGYTITSPSVDFLVAAPPASDARVVNLSTRALCQTGENVLIPGFYIEGAGTKRLLMRAVGPELARFGVSNPLPDPELILRRASDKVILGTNDDWGDGAAEDIRAAGRAVYAFGLTDGSKSAALLMDLPAGGYTLTASGKGDETGVSIVELYEVPGAGESTRLINISNRGHVGVGGNIMIPGFVVSEEGARTFLVRVVGPSLARFGVQGVLADPRLELYKRRPGTATDDLILTNDTWGENGDAAAIRQTTTAVHAFSLLEGSRDAAFVVTLPPGAYTVNAKGAGGTTGVAIVEVYLVP